MPKSAKKKSASKAVSTPAAAPQPNNNGKRDAEEIVPEKEVNGKKQKIVNGAVPQAIEKKTEAQKKENSPKEEEKKEEKEEPMNVDVVDKNEVDPNNESGSDDGDGSDEEDANNASEAKAEEDKPKTTEKAAEGSGDAAAAAEGSKEEDSSEEGSDAPSETEPPQTATGSKTLFMGNLSYNVDESDIVSFFKDAGEVLEVRLALKDGRFAGYGHVEFTTPDAAQKALKLNNELLLDRAVRLDIATERGAYTPGTFQAL